MNFRLMVLCLWALWVLVPCPVFAEFAIRDGDTVVFLGDSITAARTYGRIIEEYTLLRFPDRKVRFINAGWGGDTAAGGAQRLERDVFAHGATLLTVAYGVNDIGWGLKADDEHKKKYLEGIRQIVTQCRDRNVRVFICSAAITGQDPSTSEDSYLQKMCDEGMALSRSLGGGAIDVQRTMRGIQKRVWEANAKDEKSKETLHAADGIHLNDLGQLAMAFAILKGLGAPSEVSSAVVDATAATVIEAAGCTVSDVETSEGGLRFVRLDSGLPLNFGPLGVLKFRFIPIPDELNRYMLKVINLKPGDYALTVDGRAMGTYDAKRLADGLNISSATTDGWVPGGPWDAQAAVLMLLSEARQQVAQAQKMEARYIETNPNRAAINEQMQQINERMETLKRLVCKPVPYHYLLKPVSADATKGNR